MNYLKIIIVNCLLLTVYCLLPTSSPGQVKTDDIITIKDYKPMLGEAVKISGLPTLPPVQDLKLQLTYNLPPRLLELKYSAKEVKPVATPKEPLSKLYHTNIRVGFGTPYSFLLEVLYNSTRSEKFHYGINYDHISFRNFKLDWQDYKHNNLGLYGTYFLNNIMTFSGDLNYNREGVYFYGYDHDSIKYNDKDSVQQRFSTLSINIGAKNNAPNKIGLDYEFQFKFYSLSDLFNATEKSQNYLLKLSQKLPFIDSAIQHFIHFDVKVNPIDFNDSINRTILSFNPYYQFVEKHWLLIAGFDATSLSVSGGIDNTEFYMFPAFSLERNLIGAHLILYNGWKGTLRANTFQWLTNKNPFLAPDILLKSTTTDNKFIGLRGSFGKMTFDLGFAQKIIDNLPLFVNDTLDTRKFVVIYDKRTTIFNFHTELGYQKTEKLHLLLIADYNQYDEDTLWYMPSLSVNFRANYNLANKIIVSANIFAFDNRFAKLADGKVVELKGVIDANVSIEYHYTKNMSFFINLNNIGFQKYQQWYQYPTYGFNMLVGAHFSF